MWRLVLAFAFLSGVGLSAASAASLNASTGTLGAVKQSVPRCTTANLLVVNNLSGSNVASVTVSSIPASCASATIQAAVNNGTANGSGSSTVPAGGGSVTVTLGTAVAVTTNIQTEVLMTGP
jgi:hypothetical protein